MPFSNGIIGKTIIYYKRLAGNDGRFTRNAGENVAVLVVDKIIGDGYSNGSRTKYLIMDSDFKTSIIDATEIKSIVITTEFEKVENEL
jgi:hypothetical protein